MTLFPDNVSSPASLLGGDQLSANLGGLGKSFVDKMSSDIKKTVKESGLPWSSSKYGKFFLPISIDGSRWDGLFPYRLIVVDVTDNNAIVGGSSKTEITLENTKNGGKVEFRPIGRAWDFTLPITPSQLNITDQFSINTSATLRGVLEEHNGVKFKLIQASGTMGVWPQRSSVEDPAKESSINQSSIGTLFAGTIESASNLANQFRRVINTATSDHPANKPISRGPETSSFGFKSTGYYNALALQQFLEQYAEAKKDPKNAGWRLVFDIPKQNQSFVVTPIQYNWIQNENKATHINYSFTLKAWRRIFLKQSVVQSKPLKKIDTSTLQRIINAVAQARLLTSAAVDLIGAVRSDLRRPLDVLRQTSLFLKDLAGVAISVADIDFNKQTDFASSIKESLNIMKDALLTTATVSSDPNIRSIMKSITSSSASVEGLTMSSVSGGQLGKPAAFAQSIDPANNVFRQPERNYKLMDQVPLNTLKLNSAQQDSVDQSIEVVRNLSIADLKTFRSVIQDLALQLSNNFGTGDAFYSQIYNKPAPITRLTPITIDEYELLNSLYEVIQGYDILTATTELDDNKKQSSMEFIAGIADEANIDFQISTSKILAPVPFGLTIEQIAARYLGDPNRWIEIATLNNLRDPYIDETGFTRSLLSNASGRQITISGIEDMYLGQRVVLKSDTQAPVSRKIIGIDRLSDTSFLITLDGESNLSVFTVSDNSYIQAYLPGTVNSQQKIFIPSNLPVSDEPNILTPPSVSGDALVGLSKVDWLLTDSGDIATNAFGDFRFSAGMTNLIQAMKIKIGTQKGSMILHPDFGLGIAVGTSVANIDVQNIYNTISKMVEDDPRFQGLDSLQIALNGPSLTISMAVLIAGQSGVFPITFELAA